MTHFKNGVADALLDGNMTNQYVDRYKAGYDFRLTIYSIIDNRKANNDEQLIPQ